MVRFDGYHINFSPEVPIEDLFSVIDYFPGFIDYLCSMVLMNFQHFQRSVMILRIRSWPWSRFSNYHGKLILMRDVECEDEIGFVIICSVIISF